MENNRIFDLISDGKGGFRMLAFGTIEHAFDLGMSSSNDIRAVKVRSALGTTVLRYSWHPDYEAGTHEREKAERWISENCERVED